MDAAQAGDGRGADRSRTGTEGGVGGGGGIEFGQVRHSDSKREAGRSGSATATGSQAVEGGMDFGRGMESEQRLPHGLGDHCRTLFSR
jgi:hypothetical protein